MIRISYYRDEALKEYEPLGIIKTERLKGPHGDILKYVTFAQGLVLHWDESRSLGGDPTNGVMIWHPVLKKPVGYGWQYADMERDSNQILEIDASPEIKAEYEAYQAELERIRKQKELEYQIYLTKKRVEQEARTPSKGKYVKVIKGRKVPIGTVGEVFWYGQNKYGWGVGIELADEQRVFTSDRNVEVIKPEEVPAE